jgi:hypothetical protein
MSDIDQNLLQTLIGYREQIKNILAKRPEDEIAKEIETSSVQIDQFIGSYQSLLQAQAKFDLYLRGMVGSYSPPLTSAMSREMSESNFSEL